MIVNNELTVIKAHGQFVAQQIDQLSQTVLSNADDGVELTFMDLEQVEAVDKAIESTQNLVRSCLYWMRQKKGWLLLGYESFEDYGEKRFGYEKVYLHRLANAYEVQKALELPIGNKEIPESQLRPLAQIPESERQSIWDEANRKAEESGKERTAKMVEEAVREWKAKAEAASKDSDSFLEQLTLVENEFDEYKKTEQSRLEAYTAGLKVKIKDAERLADELRDQRDRMLKQKSDEFEALKKSFKNETEKLKADIESAKVEGSESVIKNKSEQIESMERRLYYLNEQLQEKQSEIDRITHQNMIALESEHAIKEITKAMMTISIHITDFVDTLSEYSGDMSQLNVEAWENVASNFDGGKSAIDEVLRGMRKNKSLKSVA